MNAHAYEQLYVNSKTLIVLNLNWKIPIPVFISGKT